MTITQQINSSSTENINIVADIGGTNVRVARVNDTGESVALETYQTSDYQGLAEIISSYLSCYQFDAAVVNACFAIACPVDNDLISMTNLPWQFSKKALQAELGLQSLYVINDYTAIAYAVPLLSEQQKVKVGAGQAVANKPISICGPGTGLGVANIVFDGGNCISISGEGGHVDFAPTTTFEIGILQFLLTKYAHVSYEQLLSGLGIEQIYQALCHINKQPAPLLSAEQISTKALSKECELCYQTLLAFCRILGCFAGNLALTMASFGGVYIAGGIVPRFIEFFEQSEFRKAFEAKGRFTAFNQSIATFVITEQQPGILGACAYLRQALATGKQG